MSEALYESERRYIANRDGIPEDTMLVKQDLSTFAGDWYQIKLNWKRWRSAKEWAAYLRWAAESIEARK